MRAGRKLRAWAPPIALALAGALQPLPAGAQQGASGRDALPGVTITYDPVKDPVEKSYRRMVRGMDLFEREHARSPEGRLRFKLLPRKRGVDLDRLELLVLGRARKSRWRWRRTAPSSCRATGRPGTRTRWSVPTARR